MSDFSYFLGILSAHSPSYKLLLCLDFEMLLIIIVMHALVINFLLITIFDFSSCLMWVRAIRNFVFPVEL